MNKIKSLFLLLAVVALGGLSSCIETDGDLETPKFEKDAAKYVFDSNSPFSSIELTSAGNYIVTDADYNVGGPYGKAGKSVKRHFIPTNRLTTRTYFNGTYYGNYTKTGDNQYYLEGFGTVVIRMDGKTACDITVKTEDGNEYNLDGNKVNQTSNSSKTNSLCRSWEPLRVRVTAKLGDKKLLDETINADDIRGMEDFDIDDFPSLVIFTKAGTYMVCYGDKNLDISTWKWENESDGILRYSWDLDDMYDDEAGGLVKVEFKGKHLKISESYTEEFDPGDFDDDDDDDDWDYDYDAAPKKASATEAVFTVTWTFKEA